MSIKQAILSRGPITPSEYANLILDEHPLTTINSDDCHFLEQFTECKLLSLNSCKLKNLKNLPKLSSLEQLEIEDNLIETLEIDSGSNLVTIKASGNQIKTLQDLASLKNLQSLRVLELFKNPICDIADYQKKIRDYLTQIDVVDGKDKEGLEVRSDDEEYSEGGTSKESSAISQ